MMRIVTDGGGGGISFLLINHERDNMDLSKKIPRLLSSQYNGTSSSSPFDDSPDR